jgi:predicted transport protein
MGKTMDWREMREWEIGLLEKATGQGLEHWNARVLETGIQHEAELRTWLTEEGVTGYPRMLLVMERFGYPDFLLATSDQLVDGQYADRPELRPICDRLLERAAGLGEVTIQTRKTYIALVGPRRTFAQIVATTKARVDLGLRLDGEQPHGRLLDAKNLGNRSCSVCIPLTGIDQVDDEVMTLLQRAYDANL